MKLIKLFFLINIFFIYISNSYSKDFDSWKSNFKNYAIDRGVSKDTVDLLIDSSELEGLPADFL